MRQQYGSKHVFGFTESEMVKSFEAAVARGPLRSRCTGNSDIWITVARAAGERGGGGGGSGGRKRSGCRYRTCSSKFKLGKFKNRTGI